jgi:hypothetical protein
VPRLVEAIRVFVAGVVHAQDFGLVIHHLNKTINRSADAFAPAAVSAVYWLHHISMLLAISIASRLLRSLQHQRFCVD